MAEDTAFTGGLPPEYAKVFQDYQRKLQLAQALQQRGLAEDNQPTQVISGYAVKQSPLAGVNKAIQAFLGTKMSEQAQQGIQETQGKYNTDVSDRMGVLNSFGEHPDVQAEYARSQPFPEIAKLAQKFQDRSYKVSDDAARQAWEEKKFAEEQNRLDKRAGANVQAGTGITGAAAALNTLGLPAWQPTPPAAPQYVRDPGGNLGAVTTNKDGSTDLKYAPKDMRVNVSNVIPGLEAREVLGLIGPQLKERQAAATEAKGALTALNSGMQALNEGAQAGGLENIKQGFRKGLEGFGVQMPATATTEQLSMALGQQVLAKARALAPVTGQDVVQLEKTLGSIQTNPQALVRVMQQQQAIYSKAITDYNKWHQDKVTNMRTPYAKDLFQGENIGYEPIEPVAPAPGVGTPAGPAPKRMRYNPITGKVEPQ